MAAANGWKPRIPTTPPATAGWKTSKRINPIRYQAIFFDFDGVLVESADIKLEAFRRLYQDQTPEVLAAVVAYHLEHEGISRVEKIRYLHLELLGVDLSEDALAELARQYSRLVKEAVIACSAVPGALDFLERFNAELPLFVVSGTPEEELLDIVKKRKMDKYFTAVHGSPRHKSPIVHELLQGQGLDADRCLFVGDAMTDYRAAKETGLSFIGRVGKGNRDPFPDGTTIIRDLKELSVYTFRPKGRD